jgi:hypothetical protein
MSSSAAAKSLWAATIAGIVALLVATLTDGRDLAFSHGVAPLQVAVTMQPGERACQTPFVSKQAFNALRFQVGTYRRPGPPLEVTLHEVPGRAVTATGALPAGYGDVSTPTVPVGPVPAGKRFSLCFRNRGHGPLALYGSNPPREGRKGSINLRGKGVNAELTLDFLREPKSMFSLLPTVFNRAALFRPGWLGAWTFWGLLVLLLVALPLLLTRALRSAARADRAHP